MLQRTGEAAVGGSPEPSRVASNSIDRLRKYPELLLHTHVYVVAGAPSRDFDPCVRSTLPRKTALSSTARRNACTSPSTTLPARSSTLPVATILPWTSPWMSTSRALRSAATLAL